MVDYLYENNFLQHIEMYILRVNPKNASKVFESLLVLGVDEQYIKKLLNTVGPNCDIVDMVKRFESRKKLRILETWLNQRSIETKQPEIHNALIKLAIDFGNQPEKLLRENRYYDVKEIGEFALSRDARLAIIAYQRDFGQHDDEIIKITNSNALYRLQAVYLVQRQNIQLWKKALSEENEYRQHIIELLVSSILPESKEVEQVSCAV